MLRIHQIGVHLARLIEGRANGLGRDLVERNPKDFLGIDGDNLFLRAVLLFLPNRLLGCSLFLLESRNAGFLLDELGRLGENQGEVRGDGFSLAVGVARQVNRLRGVRCLPQVVDDFALARDDLQRRLENLVVVDADQFPGRRFCFLASFAGFLPPFLFAALFFAGQPNANRLLGQVHHVADGCLDGEIPPQVFVNRFRLCGRFHNNQRTSHIAFVTP